MTYECSALYNHTNIRNGNKVYPCCRFKKQLTTFDGDVENILNSKEYVELRERFKHEKLPECSKCWEQEEKGIKSVRQYLMKGVYQTPSYRPQVGDVINMDPMEALNEDYENFEFS